MTSSRLSIGAWERGRLAAVVSFSYLLVVAATYAFTLVDLSGPGHPDASLSGVWPYLVTMPTSLVAVLAVPDSDGALSAAAFLAAPAVCSALQATGLWLALRGRRRPLAP